MSTHDHTHPDDHPTSRPQAGERRVNRPPRRRWIWVAAAVLAQGGLVAAAVAPQLSARATGQEYRLRVAPLDPIDPFRGAYVALTYPDLPMTPGPVEGPEQPRTPGPAYVPLTQHDQVWRGGPPQHDAPASGPYLACDDDGWSLRCGIDSWFVPQAEARRIEDAVRDGRAVAVVSIDDHGNAALVDLVLDGG